MRTKITAEMKAEAGAYEAAVLANLPPCPNPTGLNTPRRYYWGRLAELCFYSVCRSQGIDPRWLGNTDGISDSGDYAIDGDVIDIKFVPHNGWRFLLNEEEHARQGSQIDYYVPVQIGAREGYGTVRGYFRASDILEMSIDRKMRAACYSVGLTEARPFEVILGKWKAARQIALL